jgi:hypothetical protein
MILGLLMIGLATALGIWGILRLAAVNPTSRLVLWTKPPNAPSGLQFVLMASGVLMYFGWRDTGRPIWQSVLLAVLVETVTQLAICVVHNRRVARTV